jgi:branched-subunit amino acid transport protein AzlD
MLSAVSSPFPVVYKASTSKFNIPCSIFGILFIYTYPSLTDTWFSNPHSLTFFAE